MSDEDNIKLTLSGKLSYSGEVTFAQAVQILGLVSSGAAGPGSNASFVGPSSVASDVRSPERQQAMSPKEVLEATGAKTNPEKIVAFAALVSRTSGKETFTLEDVKPLFRQARESTPGNLTRDLSEAIKSGLVAEAEDRGEYYIVGKAADVLDTGFDGLRPVKQSKSRTRSSSARRSRKPLTVPETFADAEVSPAIEGLVNFHDVKAKRDKYLWAVYAAKLIGVEAVGPTELVWLTDRLGEIIPGHNLNANYRGNQKSGYVNKNAEGKVRITPAGEKYIKELKAGSGK